MSTKPNILAIIPARAGSKGIPGKNMRLLAGKPLIHYTFISACESGLLDTIFLSTDCEKTLSFGIGYPEIQTVFLRPKELAQDDTPTIDVIQHVIHYCDKIGLSFDYVCLLQPTSPFRGRNLIDRTIKCLIDQGGDSLVTVRKIPDKYNPHWAFINRDEFLMIATGEKKIIPRRQELPDAWYRDGQIYITRIDLIRNGSLYGEKLIGFVNEDSPDVNIDNMQDWLLAETIANNGFRQ
jgi:CMP-N,N'-diacetyllegionaminic acid synthase